MPDDDELFAVVTEHNGGNHVRVRCEDGENRMGRIPGRMKYRTWIEEGDVVLVEPWSWQDEKANIEWRYESRDADQLRRSATSTRRSRSTTIGSRQGSSRRARGRRSPTGSCSPKPRSNRASRSRSFGIHRWNEHQQQSMGRVFVRGRQTLSDGNACWILLVSVRQLHRKTTPEWDVGAVDDVRPVAHSSFRLSRSSGSVPNLRTFVTTELRMFATTVPCCL